MNKDKQKTYIGQVLEEFDEEFSETTLDKEGVKLFLVLVTDNLISDVLDGVNKIPSKLLCNLEEGDKDKAGYIRALTDVSGEITEIKKGLK